MEEPKRFYTVVDVLGKLASLPAFVSVCIWQSAKGNLIQISWSRAGMPTGKALVEFLSLHRDEGKASLFMTRVSSFDPGCEKRSRLVGEV